MSTSASERFERIFANRQRPISLPKTVPHDREESSLLSQEISMPVVREGVPISMNPVHTEVHQANVEPAVIISDDDDDEYAALFRVKPQMKTDYDKSTTDTPVRNKDQVRKSSLTNDMDKHTSDYSKDKTTIGPADSNPHIAQYCIFSLAAKFPYKYMNDPSDRVSKHFFANNKFYSRMWSLYFIHPPRSFHKTAILLVPYAEVKKLVDEISAAFGMTATVPPFPFILDFANDGTPQPIALGKTASRQEVNDLTGTIPDTPERHGECPLSAPPEVKEAFRLFHDKIEKVLQATKGKGVSKQKGAKTVQTFEDQSFQLKRVERMFGLRPNTRPIKLASSLTWEEEQKVIKMQQKECGLLFDMIDVEQPAQHVFESQPVFIAIDVESYERNHSLITEVGVSTLDTIDLIDLAPGQAGSNWVKHIRSRHFRIRGREHLVNTEFCAGNPNAFGFGRSEFVRLDEIPKLIDSCFSWPFSVRFKSETFQYPTSEPLLSVSSLTISNDDNNNKSSSSPPPPNSSVTDAESQPRNIIFLGHNVTTDITYLRKLGCSALTDPQIHILETLDTATFFQTLTSEPHPRSLSHICTQLGITPWQLHNAGNDARYTLECLVKIIIQARINEDRQSQLRGDSTTNEKGGGVVITEEWEAERMRKADERIEKERLRYRAELAAQRDAEVILAEQKAAAKAAATMTSGQGGGTAGSSGANDWIPQPTAGW